MPYMKDETISESPIAGGIEISDAQYQSVLADKLEGKKVTVRDGQPFTYSGEARTVYRLVDNAVDEKEVRKEDPTPNGWQDEVPTLPPQYKTQFSSRQFLARLGPEKRIALKTHPEIAVQLWYEELIAADFIDVNDPSTQEAADLGVHLGIFTQQERDDLLEPELIQ